MYEVFSPRSGVPIMFFKDYWQAQMWAAANNLDFEREGDGW